MSKLATVQAFKDSDPQRLQIKTVVALQQQVQSLADTLESSSLSLRQKIDEMTQALSLTTQSRKALDQKASNLDLAMAKMEESLEAWSEKSRLQMLDLAVLMNPMAKTMQDILTHQKHQDERLSRMESILERVDCALPNLVKKEEQMHQPVLASSLEVQQIRAMLGKH